MEEKKEAMKTQVYNLIVLDKSGSMESIRQEAVNGYNETLGSILAAQKNYRETQQQFVSLAVFCGCGVEMIYDKTPIADAAKMKLEQYEPCCSTPLFDAIGKTVREMKNYTKEIPDAAVLVTIITDGQENSSEEWDGPGVKALIDECKADGWMFSFIGAGHDVIEVATTISITNTVMWHKTHAGTKAVFDNENDSRSRYYEKMSKMNAECADLEQRKMNRKKFSDEYYKK